MDVRTSQTDRSAGLVRWTAALIACVMSLALISLEGCGSTPSSTGIGPMPTLGRGVNIFSHSYDPIWVDPPNSLFTDQTFVVLKKAGFQTVRLPILAYYQMDANNNLYPTFLATLDWILDKATAAGLNVIVDFHEYQHCAADVVTCQVKMTAFWQQIAPRYASRPSSVVFEILNEPMGQVTPDVWNQLLVTELAVIRPTNPTRGVLICSPLGGTIPGLAPLVVPSGDPNLIVDVHYYVPYNFTHQAVGTTPPLTWGKTSDYTNLNTDFDTIASWAATNKRPIVLGEFGTYQGIDENQRSLWTAAVARAAETRKMSWAYYELSAEFGIYNLTTGVWDQLLLNSLVPPQ